MKKVFLTIGMFVFSLGILAQQKSEEDKNPNVENYSPSIIGWWMSDKDFCHIFFWVDTYDNLKVQQISDVNGKAFITAGFSTNDKTAFVRSALYSDDSKTCVTTLNYFTLLSDKTMVCKSVNEETEETTEIVFSRMK